MDVDRVYSRETYYGVNLHRFIQLEVYRDIQPIHPLLISLRLLRVYTQIFQQTEVRLGIKNYYYHIMGHHW